MRSLRHYSFLYLAFGLFSALAAQAGDRPNILWIVSEDNGPFLGCYGDENAKTPNLDRLAQRGIRYENFFANAPVCAVARSSWIFGVPAVTTGTLHMRSQYRVPRERFKTYPELMKSAGYYVTNNSKTDYNTSSIQPNRIWNESSKKAHYRKRPDGAPFFAVFNIHHSHESRIFPGRKPSTRRVSADAIHTPPYQKGTPETIDDWRAYYERLEQMDAEVGRLLEELEASGEAENTIVVYCSDHGGVTLRSKRYLYDSGTRVPLIVSFPEKWQHLSPSAPGSASERLVQFIDLPKTFLSLQGVQVPEVMSGRVFLGEEVELAPESVFLFSGRFDEAPDNSRAVTDGRWKYIRNFEPDRPLFQMLNYPMRQAGQVSQWEAYQAGKTNDKQSAHYLPPQAEELYDTQADPDEVNNLAESRPEKLQAMRTQLRDHILARHDLGFIPEPMMEALNVVKTQTIYSFGQSEASYPLPRILDLAILASNADPANQPALVRAFQDENPIIRYWALVGLRVLGARAQNVDGLLQEALADPAPSVRIQAAICLARRDQRERALQFLLREAQTASADIHAAWALDAIKLLDAPEALDGLSEKEIEGLKKGFNTRRIVGLLQAGGSVSRMPE
ncbi:sulfatase [Coraliomargarita sinensis]|uniref:Sulfatase n=1 Tax=Coraliomargarita sinensis TaxID=2174842 RepID=A0A317ZIU2_9BACT|nr:sulfatase-like hydrolase/transferase [Coraliomargarita sinensis]PXA05634.1 sulfatase [Coraliomargarita sinensis]